MTRTLSLFLLIAILLATAAPAFADSTYVVRSGDTLYSIARKFGVTVAAIARANNITNTSLIFVGQTLVIPSGASAASSSSGTSSSTGGNTGASGATGPCPRMYIVQRGETLRRIASKCGTTVAAIVSANGLGNPNLIFVGQVLTIPNGANGTNGSTPPGAGSTGSSGGTGSTTSPTAAPTAIPAVAPTATSAPVVSGRGITGELTLCNPEKPSFAVKIERICFRELIINTTGQPVSYGVLGVQATNLSGGPSQFQTSWRGDLSIPANGVGPTGNGWEDGLYIQQPGIYRLSLAICYSNIDTCLSGGDWQTLTAGVNVTAVIWNP